MNFASDNITGAADAVLAAIGSANAGPESAYGADAWSARAQAMLCDLFERDIAVTLVATGTAANALALAALSPPWGAVFCHAEAHVMDDECGAPEFFAHGAKLVGVPGEAGRITPDALEAALSRFSPGVAKSVQPAALSLSQVTEAGTVYSVAEIAALTATARRHGLKVHMDGARFANAIAALGCTPAEMTWRAGVDVLSFGFTKNGALACEALVFFDPALAADMTFRRKQSGHTLSKGRLLGAQAVALLEEGRWLAQARHANAMASRLAQGLAGLEGVRLPWPAQANEVFPVLPAAIDDALRKAGFAYHPWRSDSLPKGAAPAPGERLVRLVTSFATDPDDVERLIATARQAV